MTDNELLDEWTRMAPTPEQRRRINAQVSAWLDAHDTSIVREWLTVFRLSPAGALGLVTVAGTGMLVASPIGLLARAVANLLM